MVSTREPGLGRRSGVAEAPFFYPRSMVAADEPRFPELPEPFASALRDLVDWVEARFDVIGLLASGTIVRGTPDPSSDFDIYGPPASQSAK